MSGVPPCPDVGAVLALDALAAREATWRTLCPEAIDEPKCFDPVKHVAISPVERVVLRPLRASVEIAPEDYQLLVSGIVKHWAHL